MVTAETHIPYDRPPLSKGILLGAAERTTLEIDYAGLRVDVRTGVRATGLDVAGRILRTDVGDLGWDALVIATGADPIRLPGSGEQVTLRTIDDALALRDRLAPGVRIVVIGSGWIGAEVATAAKARGCDVICLERDELPLARAFGNEVGKRILPWWDGIDLRLRTDVQFVGDTGVQLAGSHSVDADLVVTGIGARPAVTWLAGSGLELDHGLVTDEWLRAAPRIAAVGDAAAWLSRRYGCRLRVEHWDNAGQAPAIAVAALLADDVCGIEPYDPIPYFWSDQLGHKVQYVGRHELEHTVVWRERADGTWTCCWLDAQHRLAAALVTDLPRECAQAQALIARGSILDPELLADPGRSLPAAVAVGDSG
jgi:NADPH-dependent 2,4-dienoyl-CoA reductase/sulfur reductase-like enzyme